MGNLVHNERVKALAAALHNLGVACIVAGAVAPLFTPSDLGFKVFVYMIAGFAGAALFFHQGRKTLGELRE